MKLITITGCLGFIGAQVTKACLDKGWMVYGIDKCTYAASTEWLFSRVISTLKTLLL